jgi:hypothetical protein
MKGDDWMGWIWLSRMIRGGERGIRDYKDSSRRV